MRTIGPAHDIGLILERPCHPNGLTSESAIAVATKRTGVYSVSTESFSR